MLSWKDVLVQQERYKDALREAEKERLVRQALARSVIGRRFYSQALAWLSNPLFFWRYHLRERYGTAL
ncbi:MAG: hypothetical protein H5T63_09500 [Chloroflexi bacterium]|nr:hypothetical protein [Chloroflexota bacterium]